MHHSYVIRFFVRFTNILFRRIIASKFFILKLQWYRMIYDGEPHQFKRFFFFQAIHYSPLINFLKLKFEGQSMPPPHFLFLRNTTKSLLLYCMHLCPSLIDRKLLQAQYTMRRERWVSFLPLNQSLIVHLKR